jgi:transglutaminase-like putative cysteine protease
MFGQTIYSRVKNIETETRLIFGLLVLSMGSVSFGLSYLVRDLSFSPLLLISMGALLLSWFFARTRIPGWLAALVFFVMGTILAFFWAGDLWGSFYNLLHDFFIMLSQVLRPSSILSDIRDFNWTSLNETKLRMRFLLTELNLWLRPMIAGEPIYNDTANSLLWGFAIWSVSAWAGWFQRRMENALLAILPGGLLLTISLGYTYGRATALYPLVFGVLMLSAATFYYQRQHSWKNRSMDFPEVERARNIIITFGITLGFLVSAAIISGIPNDWVIDSVRKMIEPQVELLNPIFDSFGLAGDSSQMGNMANVIKGGLPREFLIGSGNELSDQIVMTVKLDENHSDVILPIQERLNPSIPLYWRGITYDRFTGYGWESSDVILQNYAAGESANQQFGNTYQTLRQTIHFEKPNELIYAAGELITLNTDYVIAWRGTEEVTQNLSIGADIFAGSQDRLDYQVDSLVPVVSDEALQAAENGYPDWVVERYLALPENVPQRVFDLAQTVTRYSPTAYSKASAIEAYLRTFKYELNLPAPPKNRELSDYFLFELQKGYCDYFATAMVVMARAVGVPARIAVGYTHGSYNPYQQLYIVSEENAHSWVEIYFAEIGWIPFEPTPTQPAIKRLSGSNYLSISEESSKAVKDKDTFSIRLPERWGFWFVIVFSCLTMVFIIWPFLDSFYLRWLNPTAMTTKIYKRLFPFGRLIGSHSRMSDTPYEYAAMLGNQIRVISQDSRWGSYFRTAIDDLDLLTHFYVYSIYSPHTLSKEEIRKIILLWKGLKGKLQLITALNFWNRFLQR